MSPQAERQTRKVTRGLCRACEERAEVGRTLCTRHLEADRRRKKEAFDRKRAAGLCVHPGCSEPGDPVTGRCPKHRAKNSEAWKLFRKLNRPPAAG